MKEHLDFLRESVTKSYSQVFFSDNRWFALALFVSSFSDPTVGLSGLLSVVFAVLLAQLAGFNPAYIRNGSYTYNALLVGLTMGVYFKFTVVFFVVLLLASLLTLLLSVWMASALTRENFPFLGLPFILGIWVVLLSSRTFGAMHLNHRDIYPIYELSGGETHLLHWMDAHTLPHLVVIYLKSMGAIFFQQHILSGLLITIGLLIYSRIAFSLSLIGFLSGCLFSTFVEGSFSGMEYSYIGFNYILTAIGIGGFFLVPSIGSYLLAILSAPLVSLFINALSIIVSSYYLPLYSLPFSMVIMLLLHVLHNRYSVKHLHLVQYQLFSPEKNLYAFHTYSERFEKDTYIHIHLPFYGKWHVSQGHSGEITHKAKWRFAWDFVVTDEKNQTYRGDGRNLADFYCYSLPILAPAAGQVVTVQDGIEDNTIGDVNLEENWGNTIIIKHTDYLFSKISHVKKESFKVKQGDYVKKGEMIALCGSSGRSPEPHVHFQLQSTPYIGAETLEYPISYYVTDQNGQYKLHSFEHPKEGETLLRPIPTPTLKQAFHFIPGMKLDFEVTDGENTNEESWEVFTDIYNNSYLYCSKTKSTAYFTNNETLFYFNSFSGDRDSLLYYFYLGAYKILLSYFQDMAVEDRLPIEGFYNKGIKVLQDVVAPFHIFIKPYYSARFTYADNVQTPSKIKIESEARVELMNRVGRKVNFELELSENKIKTFTITENNKCVRAENIG